MPTLINSKLASVLVSELNGHRAKQCIKCAKGWHTAQETSVPGVGIQNLNSVSRNGMQNKKSLSREDIQNKTSVSSNEIRIVTRRD